MSDYRMQHQPDPDGAPMHELSEVFPDIYSHPEYYRHGDEHYDESLLEIRVARGNPNAKVLIYRAVPDASMGINPGDWVSISATYAKQHGMHESDPAKDWPIVSKWVRAKDLRTEGNDVNEWGYFPVD